MEMIKPIDTTLKTVMIMPKWTDNNNIIRDIGPKKKRGKKNIIYKHDKEVTPINISTVYWNEWTDRWHYAKTHKYDCSGKEPSMRNSNLIFTWPEPVEWIKEFLMHNLQLPVVGSLSSAPYNARCCAGGQSGHSTGVGSGNADNNNNNNKNNSNTNQVSVLGSGRRDDDDDDEDGKKRRGTGPSVPYDPEPELAAKEKESDLETDSAPADQDLKSAIFNGWSEIVEDIGKSGKGLIPSLGTECSSGIPAYEINSLFEASALPETSHLTAIGGFRSVLDDHELHILARQRYFSRRPSGSVSYGSVNEIIQLARELEGDSKIPERKEGQLSFEGIILDQMQKKLVMENGYYEFSPPFNQWELVAGQPPKRGFYGTCRVVVDNSTKYQFVAKKIPIDDFEAIEVEVMSSLDHPNIIQLYGLLRCQDYVYILMEYIDGGTLADAKDQEEGLNWRQALDFYHDLLQSLSYMNAIGVSHGDISEENLMLRVASDKTRVGLVLVDFGIGGVLSPQGSPQSCSPDNLAEFRQESKKDLDAAGQIYRGCLNGMPIPDIQLHSLIESPDEDVPDVLLKAALDDLVLHSKTGLSADELLLHYAFHIINSPLQRP